MTGRAKGWGLVGSTLAAWLFGCVFLFPPFTRETGFAGYAVIVFSLLPRLWFCHAQTATVFSLLESARTGRSNAPKPAPPVAVLYVTCDDFDAAACRSCINQSYEGPFRVVVCDDSRTPEAKDEIDRFALQNGLLVLRRPNRAGFKAGNLNHALRDHVRENIFAVCDADTLLPPRFLSEMVPSLCADQELAFVQARHRPREAGSTRFGLWLGISIDLTYQHVFGGRNRRGFVPCFGHSIIARRDIWRTMGGFPELLSEDLAFATRALALGRRGLYRADVVCEEYFPQNCAALIAHATRVAVGGVQFWKREASYVLQSRHVSLVEKADLLITFSACFFPMALLLSPIAGYLLANFGGSAPPGCHPGSIITLSLVGPLFPLLGLLAHACARPIRVLRFIPLASIAYGGMLPELVWRVLNQLLTNPLGSFVPTGAVRARRFGLTSTLIRLCGGAVLLVAAHVLCGSYAPAAMTTGVCLALSPLLTGRTNPFCMKMERATRSAAPVIPSDSLR